MTLLNLELFEDGAIGFAGDSPVAPGDGSSPTWKPSTAPYPTIIVQQREAYGVNAGASLSGLNVRILNNVVRNTIIGAFLNGSNQVSLPAGTYRARGTGPVQRVQRHKVRIRNVTGAADLTDGTSEYEPTNLTVNRSHVLDEFILGITSLIEFQHWMTDVSTNGLGDAVSDLSGTNNEIYSILEIQKIG